MKETRSKYQIKLDALKRYLMWHYLSGWMPYYLVCEYPKSGGSWVTQMVSDYLNLPAPRNRNAKFEKSVLHGHHIFNKKFQNVIYVLRDGRDIMVSAYYHLLFNNEKNPSFMVEERRKKMPFQDYDDIESNLPDFIKYMFVDHAKGFNHFNWSDFVMALPKDDINLVKYEDLLDYTYEEMKRVLMSLLDDNIEEKKLEKIVEKYKFENISKRKQGDEDTKSFLRKGVSGDWKNKFTDESCTVFKKYGGEALIEAGYEEDLNW